MRNYKNNLVTIIIPVYRSEITDYEKISLQQCCKMLGAYQIILIKPASLNVDILKKNYPGFIIESFDDYYFSNIQGYNKLMLSDAFYGRFLSYKFMLIYQLDAFVFSDKLTYWCKSGYDYIGAPWLKEMEFKTLQEKFYFLYNQYNALKTNAKDHETGLPDYIQFMNKVGNGGLSLRNIKKLYYACIKQKSEIDFYNAQEHHFFNEDVFWGLEANRKRRTLRIPSYKKANLFSFEQYPDYAMKLSNGQLPFGCHNWDKYTDFWRPIFKQYGYNI